MWCTPDNWPRGEGRAWAPELWLGSRDGRERLAGVPCYAEPRVRERRLAELEEALGRDIDGVFLGFFSHCEKMAGERANRFGYNPCVLSTYRDRYGGEPDDGAADAHRLYALQGEHFTRFVRDASRLVRGHGKTLLCTARTDGVHGWAGPSHGGGMSGVMGPLDLRDGKSELPYAAGLYLEWEKWADEGLIDGLLALRALPRRGRAGATPAPMRRQGRVPVAQVHYRGGPGGASAHARGLAVRSGADRRRGARLPWRSTR